MSAGLIFYTDADKRITELEQKLSRAECDIKKAFADGFEFGRNHYEIESESEASRIYFGKSNYFNWGLKQRR